MKKATHRTATPEARLHALHYVAWEGVQLIRAHNLLGSAIDSALQPLLVSAAAIHTRSIAQFLYGTRIESEQKRQDRLKARRTDVLAIDDFGRVPLNTITGLKDMVDECGEQVAHLTWPRVAARARGLDELRRWASSQELEELLLQLQMTLSDIRLEMADDYHPVARDGIDYVELFDREVHSVAESGWDMEGITSGSGTLAVSDLFDGDEL